MIPKYAIRESNQRYPQVTLLKSFLHSYKRPANIFLTQESDIVNIPSMVQCIWTAYILSKLIKDRHVNQKAISLITSQRLHLLIPSHWALGLKI